MTSTDLLLQLASPALRSLAVAAAAALVLAVFRVRATSARLFTWTAVLYIALAMPLLGWVLPPLSIPVPAFAQPEFAVQAPEMHPLPAVHAVATPLSSPDLQPKDSVALAPSRSPSFSISWTALLLGIYFVVALFLLLRLAIGAILSHRLIRASKEVADPRIDQHPYARNARVLECGKVSVPVTIGVFRPAILLPITWGEWPTSELEAVLAHELSHVARRDALTQRLALLHRAIFWFSPLAWWLHRHLTNLAEQASDEAVLAGGADRNDYARTLVAFFETLHATPGRVWWEGVSMAQSGPAEQRLDRILEWKGNVLAMKRSLAFVILALAIPLTYLAASVRPVAAVPAVVAAAQAAPKAAPAPHTPATPARPKAPHPPSNSYSYGLDDDQSFVIVSGDSDSMTMSGSGDDARHVRYLRKQIPGDFIWFERGDKRYVIRDQATIDRARQFWAPQAELGKRQGELGEQQGALGKQQEELGKKMEQVHVQVPDMTAELDRLRDKMSQLRSGGATQQQVGELQEEIGKLQEKIGDLQGDAGEEQEKIGKQMEALGEQQEKLGQEQEKLGEQQEQLAKKTQQQMKVLLDEALKNGTAQPEP